MTTEPLTYTEQISHVAAKTFEPRWQTASVTIKYAALTASVLVIPGVALMNPVRRNLVVFGWIAVGFFFLSIAIWTSLLSLRRHVLGKQPDYLVIVSEDGIARRLSDGRCEVWPLNTTQWEVGGPMSSLILLGAALPTCIVLTNGTQQFIIGVGSNFVEARGSLSQLGVREAEMFPKGSQLFLDVAHWCVEGGVLCLFLQSLLRIDLRFVVLPVSALIPVILTSIRRTRINRLPNDPTIEADL